MVLLIHVQHNAGGSANSAIRSRMQINKAGVYSRVLLRHACKNDKDKLQRRYLCGSLSSWIVAAVYLAQKPILSAIKHTTCHVIAHSATHSSTYVVYVQYMCSVVHTPKPQ